MLNLKQWNYINMGLTNNKKCVYYVNDGGRYVVVLDTQNCKMRSVPAYGIKFQNPNCATLFAKNYVYFHEYEFNMYVNQNELVLKPITLNSRAQIDCETNKERAIDLVRLFRKQFIHHINQYNNCNQYIDKKGL